MTGRKGMCCAMLCLLVVSLAVVLPAGPVVAGSPPRAIIPQAVGSYIFYFLGVPPLPSSFRGSSR